MILAAGEGTRLRPLTNYLPKGMMPVANRPVMEYVVRLLASHGFSDILVNLHHMPEPIQAHFSDGRDLGVRISYQREEALLGTAGSVKRAAGFFDDTFLVIGCDDLTDVDLSAILAFHRDQKALATIATCVVEDTSHYGVVEADGCGRILSFVEKPKPGESPSNLANTGVYFFEPEILSHIPESEVYDFGRQIFPSLLEKGERFYAYGASCFWRDIGDIGQYLHANFDILDGKAAVEPPGGAKTPGVLLGKGCAMAPSAALDRPVSLGDGATIGTRAVVGPYAVLGAGTHVGARAVVRNAVVWNGVEVPDGTEVEHCVVTTRGEVRPDG